MMRGEPLVGCPHRMGAHVGSIPAPAIAQLGPECDAPGCEDTA